jgi:hypothetical protein
VKRPASVTLLLWLVLFLSAWGAVRLVAALRWWDVLNEFGASLSPLYLAAGGAVWGVAGGVLYWHMATRKPRARSALLASAFLWYGQYWVEWMFFQAPRANTGFVLTLTTTLLAVVVIAVHLPGTKTYFTMSEEHEQADEYTETA